MIDKLTPFLDNQFKKISPVLTNPYVLATLTIIVFAYASIIRPPLPNSVQKIFSNEIFRILFLFLILMISFDRAPHIALIVSIAFFFTMRYVFNTDTLKRMHLFETYRSINRNGY